MGEQRLIYYQIDFYLDITSPQLGSINLKTILTMCSSSTFLLLNNRH